MDEGFFRKALFRKKLVPNLCYNENNSDISLEYYTL